MERFYVLIWKFVDEVVIHSSRADWTKEEMDQQDWACRMVNASTPPTWVDFDLFYYVEVQ